MSKIIINEIEPKTTNGDLSITPNGTGAFEVTAENSDGVLQLNDEQNSNNVKIKASPLSAAQDHTLILPDNQIAADKFLKVKSVTGSGSTAVGQLEYATVATPSTSNLDAANFTSGNVPAARMPSSLPATSGFGLKLVATQEVTSSYVTYIVFNSLDANCSYQLIGKNITFGYSNLTTANGGLLMGLRDAAGSLQSSFKTEMHLYSGGRNYTGNIISYNNGYAGGGYEQVYASAARYQGFIVDFNTRQGSAMWYRSYANHGGTDNRVDAWISFSNSNRIHGLEFKDVYGNYFISPTKFLLYKYIES